MSNTIIKLTSKELYWCAQVGAKRHISALRKNLKPKHGLDEKDYNGWQIHIEGCCGELVVAKFLGVKWEASVDTFKRRADVAGYEVRTRSHSHYDLIVRDDDKDYRPFVLVVGLAPKYRIVGTIMGKDAKQKAYSRTWADRPSAYFVPQSVLKPLEKEYTTT